MDTILIVDDENLICRQLEDWLEKAEYRVVIVNDGGDALKVVSESPPDLILLNLIMPKIGGLAVCQKLKEDEKTFRIPIILLTGIGTSEDRIRCLDAGADDFLNKPVNREELLARIRSLLRAKHLSDHLLISYYQLDSLGDFAEAFAGQTVTNWRAADVATSMAQQVIGTEPKTSNHPSIVWGGMIVKGTMYGIICYYDDKKWHEDYTEFDPEQIKAVLAPFSKGVGQYFSKEAPSKKICELLKLPEAMNPANFVAILSERQAVLTAGYPWEVGYFEIPLLRAVLRHWSVFERIRYEARQTEKAFFYTMEALATAAEFYDNTTSNHIKRVGTFAGAIANELGCDRSFIRWLTRCAQMHDVGKITIPLDITNKSGTLSRDEKGIMKTHTSNGAKLLGGSTQLAMARNIALSHHESYDGTGYPEGLRGEDIPLEARIVKIVDIYDALRSKRPYKPAYSHDKSLKIIKNGDERTKPSQIDPRVMESFFDISGKIKEFFDNFSDSR